MPPLLGPEQDALACLPGAGDHWLVAASLSALPPFSQAVSLVCLGLLSSPPQDTSLMGSAPTLSSAHLN